MCKHSDLLYLCKEATSSANILKTLDWGTFQKIQQ